MSGERWTRGPVSRRGLLRGAAFGLAGLAGAAIVGCADGGDDAATATPGGAATATTAPATTTAAPATATQAPAVARAELYVLSNSSPHVSVIDTATNEVVRSGDITDFTTWTWNDDRNWSTSSELFLGLKHPDTTDVEVATLDFETLDLTHRIPLGKDDLTLYIGQAASDGTLQVGKMGSGQVVSIDTATYSVLNTWDVPVNGDVVCDADISIDDQGVERFAYPTRKGDTVVTLDPKTGETLSEVAVPAGSTPLMLSAGPRGRLWVQDTGSSTNSVYAPEDLKELARIPSGKNPIVATFSPDGALAYIGHGDDTFVQVIDTESFTEVQRVVVGTNPQKLAVHPDGSKLYAILTKEGAVAVIDTATWEVTARIALGTNPNGISLRSLG